MPRSVAYAIVLALTLCIKPAFATFNISVDASKPLGPVNPIWRDFAQGGESSDPNYLQPLIKPMRALKARLIRFDHPLNNYLKVSVKDDKLTIDFTALDRQIDNIRAMGAQPLMCISYTPVALGGEKSTLDPPNNRRLWGDLVYQLVKHINGDRKLGVRYWELWNEPNGTFWHGTKESFFELYRTTEKAVLQADPTVKFGAAGYALFPKDWIRMQLEFVKSNNLRMDFLSWHDYWDAGYDLVEEVETARAWLKELGLSTELVIDEWNDDAAVNPDNDDENGAVYVADFLCKMTELRLHYTPFFEIKDGPGPKRYWGRWGLFTSDDHPKANYNTFLGFSKMEGDLLSFTGGGVMPGKENVNKGTAKIGGMAVGRKGQIDVVLYNTSKLRDESAELTISGLSASPTRARIYLIDRTHSNPAIKGQDVGLEQTQVLTLRPKAGKAKMTIRLPKRSVTFVHIDS